MVVSLVLCDKVLSSVTNWRCEQGIEVKSMSGLIRRLIGPTKSRCLKYIKTANGLMERKSAETQLDEEQSEAEDFGNRISTNIALFEKCNNDWSNILKELKATQRSPKGINMHPYVRVKTGL